MVLLVCPVIHCKIFIFPTFMGRYWEKINEKPWINSYFYSAENKILIWITNKLFLKNITDNWYKTPKHFKDTLSLSLYSSIYDNDFFPAGVADGGFKIWAGKIILTIEVLYMNGTLMWYLWNYAQSLAFLRNIL